MKKVPTIFERDRSKPGFPVIDEYAVSHSWLVGAMPHRKYDGTCCLIRGGQLFKRREVKAGKEMPSGLELVGRDEVTGEAVGWLPVGEGPEDRWHREALGRLEVRADGTYELCGPHVQSNRERLPQDILIAHAGTETYGTVPIDFASLRDWLSLYDIEGLVFHHPDGRMAKIKKRDFGLARAPDAPP